MNIPTIFLRRALNITMKDTYNRMSELNSLDRQSLYEEYREWIHASEGNKDHPHVLYTNQINIEQL